MPADHLRNTLMFSSFDEKQFKHLNQMTHVLSLAAGESLFQQGQPFSHFYYLKSGIIKLSRLSESGTEKVIELIRDDQYFAEALAFLNSPEYPVMSTAVKDCELIAIDAQKYIDLLKDSTDACFSLMADMSKRIHSLVSDIDALTLHSSKSRVAGYLIKCMNNKHSHTINLELTKTVIASRLSMKPETFSRALHNLSNEGVITVNKRSVQINNEILLMAIANDEESL
jgi:CRP-like cAMP-binding protein